MKSTYRKNFPKILPQLSSEDKIIHDDFNKLWLTELNSKKIFSLIENFNHNYSAKSNFLKNFNKKITTLEIGCGIGNHIDFEDLDFQEYHAVDLKPNVLNVIKKKNKEIKILEFDVQNKMPYNNSYFDRINAIHILEHLPNLPVCIDEIYRLLNNQGIFQVVIPCDPGFFYEICRSVSARRIFEKKYKKNYDSYIKREHINNPNEIIALIKEKFINIDIKYFPFLIPSINFNLCIGLTFKKIKL